MRLFDHAHARFLSAMLACAVAAGAAGCYGGGSVYVATATPVSVEEEESAPASVTVFYDRLEPYGEWIEITPYGRVWRPYPRDVGEDFVPYATGGTWVNTDAGWAFETDYAWGWAAYHYGRWFYDDERGWVWVPDTVWGPAWVDWRYGDDYIGWAPLAPPGVVIREHHWAFVESRHFTERGVIRYALPRERVHVAFTASVRTSGEVAHGGARWYGGPPVEHVTRVTGRPVHTVHVEAPAAGTIRVRRHAQPTIAPAGRPSRPSGPPRR